MNNGAPAYKLKTSRGLGKFILLTIVTLGIYSIVYFSNISTSLNTAAGRYDGKKTMHYCLVFFLFSWLTLGIVPIVWMHKMSNRVGDELTRRNLPYSFGCGAFWGWYFFGSMILVGPFIYIFKLSKAMNMVCEDYNARG